MLHIIHQTQKDKVCGGKEVSIPKPRPIRGPRPSKPKPDFNIEVNDNQSNNTHSSDSNIFNVVWGWIYPSAK